MGKQTKVAKQVIAAKKMIAAADAAEAAAEKRGYPLSDAELKKLGYVKAAGGGGVLELNIPVRICKILVAEDRAKKS